MLQLARGVVHPRHLEEQPDIAHVPCGQPNLGRHAAAGDAVTKLTTALMRTYPDMDMTVTLQQKTPLYIDAPHPGDFVLAGEKPLSSETVYTLQRQRHVPANILALPGEELQRRVAKRMRVDARAAAHRVADPTEQPAADPTDRTGVEIVDEQDVRKLPKLTTHVSTASWLQKAKPCGRLEHEHLCTQTFANQAEEAKPSRRQRRMRDGNYGDSNYAVPPTSVSTQRYIWDQKVHDNHNFGPDQQKNAPPENAPSCGAEACLFSPQGVKPGQDPFFHRFEELNSAAAVAAVCSRKACLRCRMAVFHVPAVMRQARHTMGGDCWEDGLKVVIDIKVAQGRYPAVSPGGLPAFGLGPNTAGGHPPVTMRVERGPPCPPAAPPQDEPEAAPPQEEGPEHLRFGDDEL
jgi:hypothetical protein